jgi:PQQ-like domain
MNCTSCGSQIPPAVASAPFCAFCGARRLDTGPAGQLAGAVAAAAAAVATPVAVAQAHASPEARSPVFTWSRPGSGAKPEKAEKVFTTGAHNLCMAFDPQIGFALVGVHAETGKASLRAYGLQHSRVLWSAPLGQPESADIGWSKLAARSGCIFVSPDRSMHVLDLATGARRWSAEFSDVLRTGATRGGQRGLAVLDASPPGQRGAILAITADYALCAFDRDSGQPLWREVRENAPGDGMVIPDPGLVYLERTTEVLNPFFQKPVASFGGRVERIDVEGRYGALQVRHWGWLDREGISLHDFAANKELFFEGVADLEDDVPSIMGHGRVFAAVENGAKLTAAPHGKPVELVPGFKIRGLSMCGPTLFALLEKTHGTSYRRIVGVDPATLALRFDLGELTTQPNDDWTGQMCSSGQIAVVVTSPTNDDDHCELWGVDPGGRRVWKVPVGEWTSHYMLGGLVVVQSSGAWRIVRPENGEVVAQYGNPQT